MKPYYEHRGITIYHGDAMEVLPTLENLAADIVLTDPPYSSGGFTRSDRNQTTTDKYQLSGTARFLPDFTGDNRDQMSLLIWVSLWAGLCRRCSKPGAALGSFIDWRGVSVLTNAVQVAGWILRGLSVWDKTEQVRPAKGFFRQQAEFIVWGSFGPFLTGHEVEGECGVGVFRHAVNIAEKKHLTQKPLPLMLEILSVRKEWKTVLDPFMGAGTTLEAAKRLNMNAVGIEIEEKYCEIAANRLSQEVFDYREDGQ